MNRGFCHANMQISIDCWASLLVHGWVAVSLMLEFHAGDRLATLHGVVFDILET
jgi:hypothetical protein